MKDAEFTELAGSILKVIQSKTPKDTGNLRYNATRIESAGFGRFRIYVNTRIAPYIEYVDGYKKIKGKTNGNHGYFDRSVKEAVKVVAKKYGGRVEGV